MRAWRVVVAVVVSVAVEDMTDQVRPYAGRTADAVCTSNKQEAREEAEGGSVVERLRGIKERKTLGPLVGR